MSPRAISAYALRPFFVASRRAGHPEREDVTRQGDPPVPLQGGVLPSAVRLRLGFQPGLAAETAQQTVRFKSQKISAVLLLLSLKRSALKPDGCKRKRQVAHRLGASRQARTRHNGAYGNTPRPCHDFRYPAVATHVHLHHEAPFPDGDDLDPVGQGRLAVPRHDRAIVDASLHPRIPQGRKLTRERILVIHCPCHLHERPLARHLVADAEIDFAVSVKRTVGDLVGPATKRHEHEVLQFPSVLRVHLRGYRVDKPRVDHVVLVRIHSAHRQRIGHDRHGIDEIGVLEIRHIVRHVFASAGIREVLEYAGYRMGGRPPREVVQEIVERVHQRLHAHHLVPLQDVAVEHGVYVLLKRGYPSGIRHALHGREPADGEVPRHGIAEDAALRRRESILRNVGHCSVEPQKLVERQWKHLDRHRPSAHRCRNLLRKQP